MFVIGECLFLASLPVNSNACSRLVFVLGKPSSQLYNACIRLVFVIGKPFHSSLMFVVRPGADRRMAHLKSASLG